MIAAEGEHKASRALRHAADVISENPAALQVMMMMMMMMMVAITMMMMMRCAAPAPAALLSKII